MKTKPWNWLFVVCFLDLFGASMIMPVFSAHLRTLGFSHTSIGFLSSLYGFFQLISGPIIGSWSDVNGRQKIFCLAMVICAVAYAALGTMTSFYAIVMIRCLLGIFKHSQTLCRAAAADIVPASKQSSVYGLMNAVTSFSFMAGPLISGHVMEFENGFQILCACVFLIYISNTIVLLVFAGNVKLPNKMRKQSNDFIHIVTSVFRELYVIEWRKFWPLLLIRFLLALTGIIFFQNIGLILSEHFKISPRYIGYTISFYGLISGLSSFSTSKTERIISHDDSPLKCFQYTFAVFGIALLWLYTTDNYPLFLAGLIPLASSQALSRTLMTRLLIESSDVSFRGSMMGASSSCASIARIVAPTIGGLVTSWGGLYAPLLVSAMIAFSAVLLTVSAFTMNNNYKSE